MRAARSARLTTAVAVRGVSRFEAAIEDLRRGSNHGLLVVAIVASTAMVALLDFWTSAELVGSILFTVPLVVCALQPSKRLLWSVAAAAGVLTLAAGFWGVDRAGTSASGAELTSRALLVTSLLALTAFIHLWLRKARLGALDATEIQRQRDSLADQNLQLEALVATATRDIVVRKDADKHLAQMEARYRGLLEAAPDAMVVVDQAGAIVLLNLQAERQFGYPRDELIGQQVKNIIPEGFAERLIADDARTAAAALAQQIGAGIELIGLRKDGSEFPMELMLSPLESDGGILVTAAIRDISVRWQAEEHLAQMEARYRGLLEAAPDGMVVVNQTGEIVIVNLQAEHQFGYRRDELLGLPVKNIIPEGFAERLIADGTRTAAEALVQQIGTGLELIGRRKDGGEFPIELMLSPLENPDGILVTAAIRDIGVRKQAEEHLAQMEARYRGLLEAAPDGMVVVNQTGEIVLLNLQAEKQFGYRRDELLGLPVKNIIPEGFAERLIADGTRTAAEALAQQIGTGLELIGRRKDGSEFPIELMLSPLENADGILVTAAIRDIGVRKQAEEHLAQMEARYRGLLEAAPDGMVVVNQTGEIVILNLQAEKQFGYRRDELLGLPVKNIIPEGFAERLIADGTRSSAEALAQQIGSGIELIGRRKDGSEFPMELMLSPLEDTDGFLVTAAIRDVTARHADQDALRASEEWHRMAVEVTELGTWVWDIASDAVTWSDRFKAIYGLTPKAVLTRQDSLRRVHADDRKRVERGLEEAIERHTAFDMEYRIIWADGSEHWLASKGRVRRSADGAAENMQGTVLDITERRAGEESLRERPALERTSAELMRSNADLQQFAYVAAHDLQEPLRMVSSYTQLLAKRYKGRLDPNADEFIAFAVDGAQRMQLLISDLLSYCQVGTAGQDFSETSASEALALAIRNLRGAIEESGGAVTQDKLPTLVADHAQLVQLFQNLVGNALKYRGTEPPRVHVSAKKNAAKEWVFSVRDNGLGIEPKYFKKIFLMFQRLHGREEFSGTGIGLSLCKKIAERHGGRIWVKSAAAGGSTFFVAFPEAGV
jgi:PAS domain S-box-containing protein